MAAEFPIFTGAVPFAIGTAEQDIPTLTHYPPGEAADSRKMSLLICPGGGYNHLAAHEGAGYAEWFSARGFSCYVLKYRLASNGYAYPAMLADVKRAMRTVRHLENIRGNDELKIGIIGSSAGGHLAATLSTRWDKGDSTSLDPIECESCRPNCAVLAYPVISFADEAIAHKGSGRGFLGSEGCNSPTLQAQFSPHLNVNADTPPAFLWHTAEDKAVPAQNSLLYANGLLTAGVPCELHIYPRGAHGQGLRSLYPWAESCLKWLQDQGA